MEWICKICKVKFQRYIRPAHLKSGKGYGRYCSKECKHKALSIRMKEQKPEESLRWKGGLIKRQCFNCDKEIEVYPRFKNKPKFCSPTCVGIYMSTRRHPHTEETKRKMSKAQKGRKHSEESKKRMSEAQKRNPNRYWLGKKRPSPSIETRKKMSKAQSGSKGSAWKGGITKESLRIRHSLEYHLWREAVFARDNWICQKCEVRGGSLVAHHIQNFAEYPELRFAIDNGATLCKECHKSFHKKYGKKNNTKEQLIEYFNE